MLGDPSWCRRRNWSVCRLSPVPHQVRDGERTEIDAAGRIRIVLATRTRIRAQAPGAAVGRPVEIFDTALAHSFTLATLV